MKQVWIILTVFVAVVIAGLYLKPNPKIPEGFQNGPSARGPTVSSVGTSGPSTTVGTGPSTTVSTPGPTVAKLLPTCISRAYYDAMGKITIEPQNMRFSTANEFMTYFNTLQKQNPSCILPTIENYNGPLTGVLGGQGTGTESADQVALESGSRALYTTTEGQQDIYKLEDYELPNRDRNNQLLKQQKSSDIAQYQMDWPNMPYDSDARANFEDQFVENRMNAGFRDPKTGVFFNNLEGSQVAPPDQDAVALREAKMLSDYQPTSLTVHQVDDETERVAKVVAQTYKDDPDWEPVVEKVAEHQYRVRELRPRARKTEWEGEQDMTVEDAQHQGLLTGGSTKAQINVQKSEGDPYFAKDGVADYANNRFWKYNEFDKWTPGLERMFAPTNDTQQWS